MICQTQKCFEKVYELKKWSRIQKNIHGLKQSWKIWKIIHDFEKVNSKYVREFVNSKNVPKYWKYVCEFEKCSQNEKSIHVLKTIQKIPKKNCK